MHDHQSTTDRRKAMADATSQKIGEILHKARSTSDPVKLVELRGEVEKLDPTQSLDALIVMSDFVANLKPANLKRATADKDKSEKAVKSKQREIEETTLRLSRELDAAITEERSAIAKHARAVVDDNRMNALKTGIAQPGAQDYARPEIRAWAKLAKII